MEHFEEIKKTIGQYDIIYGLFKNFRLLNYHRDFEIIIQTEYLVKKLRIILEGVVSVDFKSVIKENAYKMEKTYLSNNPPPNPIEGWVWGVGDFELMNYYLTEENEKIKAFQKDYNFKLFSLTFVVSTSEIEFIFHDLMIEELAHY